MTIISLIDRCDVMFTYVKLIHDFRELEMGILSYERTNDCLKNIYNIRCFTQQNEHHYFEGNRWSLADLNDDDFMCLDLGFDIVFRGGLSAWSYIVI